MRKITAGYALLLILIAAAVAYAALSQNIDGSITDSTNAISWTKHVSTSITHTDASTAADNFTEAGFGDWRLPTQTELESLVDTNYYPKIDPIFGLSRYGVGDWTFWTSTEDPNAHDYVEALRRTRYVLVSFDTGASFTAFKAGHYSARYVRDIPDNPIYWDSGADTILWTDLGDTVEWH